MNRPLLLALLALALPTLKARAEDKLPWLPADQLPKQATLAPAKAGEQALLQVTGPTDAQGALVLIANNPKVTSHRYVLRGKVKYEGVESVGNEFGTVILWNHFPDGGFYFTRTLAPNGPLGRLEGTSDWRTIELPFESKPGLSPTKLTLHVVLPGKGTVHLSPLTLDSNAAWWTEPGAGLIGGLGGGLIGLVGATIGVLAGLGRARPVVIGLCVAVIACGALTLAVGVFAVLIGQPWHVYYPLLLAGGIGAIVCGANLPVIRRRFDALELRRMSAMDA